MHTRPGGSAEEVLKFFQRIESRLKRAQDEAVRLRWYARLNPIRQSRLRRYRKELSRAQGLWRNGDSGASLGLLRNLELRYPSVIGLLYGNSRKNERRKEVYELQEERALKRKDQPYWGLLNIFFGDGGGV